MFTREPRPSFADVPAPKRSPRSMVFAIVSVGLVAAALVVSWLLFSADKLPRWTGSAPPEDAVDTTEITSAPRERP
ncbi:MAG: hypothetical protein JST00_24695 [Deltaproteobacteria bacterium]|nr:hypothetical protein [Deltaproteobacteria bacterium]